jgi:RNA polymerase sigma-70 factor (ECF subfamily)
MSGQAKREPRGRAMVTEEGVAIEVVWARHHDRLERLLTRMTHDVEAARDLTTDAFVRLSLELAAGRAPRNPEAWLCRVGTNLAFSRGRHLTLERKRTPDIPPPANPDGPETIALFGETSRELGRALAGLSACERASIALAAQGMRAADIGLALGRTPSATRTLLCRARAKLRLQLAGDGLTPREGEAG